MIITIAGRHGSGSSSVATLLAQLLGYETPFSTGDMREKLAVQLGITGAEFARRARTDPELHQKTEDFTREFLQGKENAVYESWLAHWVIKDFSKKVCVLLTVDPNIGAQRIFNHLKNDSKVRTDVQKVSSSEEIQSIHKQQEEDWIEGVKAAYGFEDPFAQEFFDIVLCTNSVSEAGIAKTIHAYLMELNAKSL